MTSQPPAQPLADVRILVTRPAAQASPLAARIEALGGIPVRFPTLLITPPDDLTASAAAVKGLPAAKGAIFISANAARHGLELIQKTLGAVPENPDYLAVGPASRAVLTEAGIQQTISPKEEFSSEGLLTLASLQPPLNHQLWLIFRGQGGREHLAEQLRQRGAEVKYVSCYRRSLPTNSPELATLWRNPGVDWTTASSQEGLKNLLTLAPKTLQPALQKLPLMVLSKAIAERAETLGFRAIHIAPAASDQGLLRGITAIHRDHRTGHK